MGRNCGCRGRCSCGKTREIVYPTREEVRDVYSEETVRHIYPTHRRVINHHTIRNEYYYPQTTSYEERVREVDVRGARTGGPGTGFSPGSVAGARSPFDGFGRSCGSRGGCGCGGRGRCGGCRRGRGFWG